MLRLMMSRLGSHLCPNGHRVAPSIATPAQGDRLPGVRRALRASQRRILRVQLLRRVPGLPGPGRAVRGRRHHPGSRSGQDDRGRRGAAVEFRRAAAVDVRRGRARRPARRAVPVADRARARHRAARRAGSAAGDAAARAGPGGPCSCRSTTTTRSPPWNARCAATTSAPAAWCSASSSPASARCATAPGCGPRRSPHSSAAATSPRSARSAWASCAGSRPACPPGCPPSSSRMTTGLLAELNGRLTPLLDVGLGYLTLDRAGASLSTGERQRIELTSTVRASTTGMLYVLDEPSVGLHPSNVQGLRKTITALAGNGNYRGRGGARAGAHPRRGLGHRTRPRGRGQRRHGHRRGHPRPAGDRPALDHGPVPGRRPGRAARPPGAARSRRADHHRDRRPVQPARPHRRLPGAAG